MNKKNAGWIVAALVAGAALYFSQPKKVAKKKTTQPEAPGIPAGTAVTLPPASALLGKICNAYRLFDSPPTPEDLVLLTLESIAPQAKWPAVIGDHPTMVELQLMVTMKVGEMAKTDPTQTPAQNLQRICKPGPGSVGTHFPGG